jgi:hypothetical protein
MNFFKVQRVGIHCLTFLMNQNLILIDEKMNNNVNNQRALQVTFIKLKKLGLPSMSGVRPSLLALQRSQPCNRFINHITCHFKGTRPCHEIFDPWFFPQTALSSPLIQGLKSSPRYSTFKTDFLWSAVSMAPLTTSGEQCQ